MRALCRNASEADRIFAHLRPPSPIRPGHATQPADQRYANTYLFGAICPAHGKEAGLVQPFADTQAMQRHLEEIARHVAQGAQGVLLMDRAGWHTTKKLVFPENITPIPLPLRAPKLNPIENIWRFIRANWLSNRVFEDYDAILNAACHAWNKLIALPQTIRSTGRRTWTHIDQ